jgi:hypothetical protein
MRRVPLLALVLLAVALVACDRSERTGDQARAPAATPAATEPAAEASAVAAESDLEVVIAPGVQGRVDEALIREAFRRAVDQGERDFGLLPERTVTVYVDPDSAIGLEDALGLSARTAIHLRAGRTTRLDSLLPLMMHEYTHVLQYQIGRLRPQWWIEGQADHQAQRVLDPGRAARERTTLLRSLGSDVRANRAPALADLRGSTGWDEYIKRSGAGKAYGWGHAAVAFIEDGWGFAAVSRIMRDADGPNTLSSFDAAVQRETGLGPAEFEAGLRAWLVKQG